MLVNFLINLVAIFSVISLFHFIRYTLKIKKVIKMQQDNPNIKGVVIVNGHIQVIEGKPEEPKCMVQDSICGQWIAPEEAYCVMMDGKKHYFCSWECREAFLRKERKVHEG